MPHGPGKYDDVADKLLDETGAVAVVLVIIGGKSGSGAAVKHAGLPPGLLSAVVRELAEGMAKDGL